MNKSIYRNIAVVCTLALFAMPAMAQKAVQTLSDAFDDFTGKLVKERQITMVVNNNYGDGYYQEFHFKTLLNTVKKFDETMMDNAKQAYNSFMKADGVDALGNAGLNIAYGEKNKDSRKINYERNCNYNVQFFRDSKDKNKRYAYVLVWKKDGDKASGYMLKVYGVNPQSVASATDNTKLAAKPTNSQEFMQEFGNLRSLYVKQNDEVRRELQWRKAFDNKTSDKLPLLTGVANKIAALCSNYGKLLNSADYQLVRQTLKEMQQTASDNYVGSLLGATSENLASINPKP